MTESVNEALKLIAIAKDNIEKYLSKDFFYCEPLDHLKAALESLNNAVDKLAT